MGNYEIIQLKFCNNCFVLKTTTPNCMVYGELERYPVKHDIKLQMISHWGSSISGKDITKYML